MYSSEQSGGATAKTLKQRQQDYKCEEEAGAVSTQHLGGRLGCRKDKTSILGL